jgi:acetolactate decarboxylase
MPGSLPSGSFAKSPSAVLPPQNAGLFQYSTLDALSQGVFDGELMVGQLKASGSYGLGTFNHLDGELVMLDGNVYQVPSSGKVRLAPDTLLVPFAAAVPSLPSETFSHLEGIRDLAGLQAVLDTLLESRNHFHAFRIEGAFAQVRTRSVPSQSMPYGTLAQAVKGQVEFEAKNVEGTLVVLFCPAWAKGINLPGYHIHFISKDRDFGGHVLGCQLSQAEARGARLERFSLQLPGNAAFKQVELPIGAMQTQQLNKAEAAPGK